MNPFLNAANYRDLCVFECGKESCLVDKMVLYTKKSYHLFHYVVKGKGTFIIANKEYHLSKGSIFYIPPKTDAVYYPDKEDTWTYIWVGFFGSAATEYINYLGLNENNPIIFDSNNLLKSQFINMVTHYSTVGFCDIHLLGSLYQLFANLVYKKQGKSELSNTKVVVQLAKDFIFNNYQNDITVIDIASSAHVTPNCLSIAFQKEEGMSTKQFLTMVRMEKALLLLKSKSFKVKEVSEMSGYKNQLYFSNEFKKYYGESPLSYISKGV